jgi:hypothetical protein
LQAKDEYELYIYVQFDPHVQQVIDEQLLTRCSTGREGGGDTVGGASTHNTVVVSRSFGSGSNDVTTAALVGPRVNNGDQDDAVNMGRVKVNESDQHSSTSANKVRVDGDKDNNKRVSQQTEKGFHAETHRYVLCNKNRIFFLILSVKSMNYIYQRVAFFSFLS